MTNLASLKIWNWEENVPFLATVIDGLEFPFS
jgi:hypothetical protein